MRPCKMQNQLFKFLKRETYLTFRLPLWRWKCEYCSSHLGKCLYQHFEKATGLEYERSLTKTSCQDLPQTEISFTASLVWLGLPTTPWPGHLLLLSLFVVVMFSIVKMVMVTTEMRGVEGEWETKWKVVAQFPKYGWRLTTTSQAVCAPSGAWRRRREQRGRGGGGLPSAGEGGVLLCFSLLRTKIINFKENDFEASCICQMKSTLLVDYGWLGWFGHLAGLARVLRSRRWSFPSQTILFVGGWTLFCIIFHFNFWPHQTYNGLCYVSPLVS